MASASVAIVTGSTASERGWESARLRHGIFSYALYDALTGTAVQRNNGTISVLGWLDAAVHLTSEETAKDGVEQTPTRFIHWAGDVRMPLPETGRHLGRLRERDAHHQITASPASLEAYGLSSNVIASVRAMIGGGELNRLQLRAVNEGGALVGRNVLVSAPTSSGKTLVGYLAALVNVARRGRAVFLVPSRALANEKWLEFQAAFENGGIRAIRSFGGVDDDDPALRTNHYDVAFLTYEKFLMLALTRPYVLDAVTMLVLDEVHLISDPSRGKTVELLLTLVRRRSKQGKKLQVIALSAALGDLNKFDAWLNATLIAEPDNRRPVALREGVVSPSGRFCWRDSNTGAEGTAQVFSPVSSRTAGEYPDGVRRRVAAEVTAATIASPAEKILLFLFAKNNVRGMARHLGARLHLPACSSTLNDLDVQSTGRDDSAATTGLLDSLRNGVGFHVADLDQTERDAIERAFRAAELRVLVATSGLAMGVNTPATAVVIVDHIKYIGHEEPYSVGEYKNMAGRAGRPAAGATQGVSYLCAADDREADKLFEQYVNRPPEPIESQLARLSVLDLTIALLVLTGPCKEGDLLATARETFDGFRHHEDAEWRRQRREEVRAALDELRQVGYVEVLADKTIGLTPAGRVLGRSSVSVSSSQSVIAAARAIRAADEPLDQLALVALAQLTVEAGEVYVGANADSASVWIRVTTEKFLAKRPATARVLLTDDPGSCADQFKRMYCACRWAYGVPIKSIETEIAAIGGGPESAAGMVRSVASRTASMISPLAKILGINLPDQATSLRQHAVAVFARLEVGAVAAAAALARLRLGLRRGELIRLVSLDRATFEHLRSALRAREPNAIAVFGDKRAGRLLARMDAIAHEAAKRVETETAEQLRLFDDVAAVDTL